MRFLRERFSKLKPYHSAYISEGVILNANESPYAPPAEFKEYIKEHLDELLVNRYPDTDNSKLANAIARTYGVRPTNVICGVGSDELIDCILSSTIDENDKVLIPSPSFSMYGQFTLLNSGYGIEVPLKDDFSYDVDALEKTILNEQPKVVFLCNPNNPTGCILRRDEIERLLKASKGLVVVDEAYEDFASEDISSIDLIEKYNNLIVLRTFSKAYALAGARVGYGIACEEVIDLIGTVIVPYNLSVFSQLAATWCIEHRPIFLENAKKIMSQRESLDAGLKALGYRTYPSQANFIWCELEESVFEALQEQAIYIRKMTVRGKVYFRITIGTPEENATLLAALKALKEK